MIQPLPAALDWTARSALFQSQIDYDSQINRLRRPLLGDETQTDIIKDLFESKVNEWKEGGQTISYEQIEVDEQLLVNKQMDRQKYGQKEFANFNIDSNFVSHLFWCLIFIGDHSYIMKACFWPILTHPPTL